MPWFTNFTIVHQDFYWFHFGFMFETTLTQNISPGVTLSFQKVKLHWLFICHCLHSHCLYCHCLRCHWVRCRGGFVGAALQQFRSSQNVTTSQVIESAVGEHNILVQIVFLVTQLGIFFRNVIQVCPAPSLACTVWLACYKHLGALKSLSSISPRSKKFGYLCLLFTPNCTQELMYSLDLTQKGFSFILWRQYSQKLTRTDNFLQISQIQGWFAVSRNRIEIISSWLESTGKGRCPSSLISWV